MDRFFVQSQEKRENQRGDFACLQYHAKDDYKPPRCVSLSVHAVARLDTNAQNQDSGSSAICAVMQDWTLLSHCRTPGADRKGQSRPRGLCRASLLFCWTVRRGKQQLDHRWITTWMDRVPPSIGSANYVSKSHCRLVPAPITNHVVLTIGAKLYQGGSGLPNPWELPPPPSQGHNALSPPVVNQWSGRETGPPRILMIINRSTRRGRELEGNPSRELRMLEEYLLRLYWRDKPCSLDGSATTAKFVARLKTSCAFDNF